MCRSLSGVRHSLLSPCRQAQLLELALTRLQLGAVAVFLIPGLAVSGHPARGLANAILKNSSERHTTSAAKAARQKLAPPRTNLEPTTPLSFFPPFRWRVQCETPKGWICANEQRRKVGMLGWTHVYWPKCRMNSSAGCARRLALTSDQLQLFMKTNPVSGSGRFFTLCQNHPGFT